MIDFLIYYVDKGVPVTTHNGYRACSHSLEPSGTSYIVVLAGHMKLLIRDQNHPLKD